MLDTSESARNRTKEGRTAVLLVFLMLTSLMVSLVPAVSASHITQYAVQRDPSHLSLGDLDCDGVKSRYTQDGKIGTHNRAPVTEPVVKSQPYE